MLDLDDLPALRKLGLNNSLLARLIDMPETTGTWPARITEVQRERCTLLDGQGSRSGRVLPELQRELFARGESLAVGDWVLAAEDGWILQRVPPLNVLSRRSPEGHWQPLVANVDTALLVMGLDHDFKLARLDRYLLLTRAAGVAAVVALTKADLHADSSAQRLAELRQHLAHSAALEVLAVDATQAATRERLAPWLAEGQTLVLLGSSGAGKSTLTNTLCGSALQATGAVREDDSRGRHTTTVRTLYRTPEGACIIDTPGLRGLQLDADEAALAAGFDDVARLAAQCRFRNCTHGDEPGCAVREHLSPQRLQSYHKLQREARHAQQDPRLRQQLLAEWKRRSRAARERIASKQGRERA